MIFSLQYARCSIAIILAVSCSFDRHALDLLDKMLNLDPAQVWLLWQIYLLPCRPVSAIED